MLPRWQPLLESPPSSHGAGTGALYTFAQWWKWCGNQSDIIEKIKSLAGEIEDLSSKGKRSKAGRRLAKQLTGRKAQQRAQCSAYDAWAALAPYTRCSGLAK